MTTSLGLVNASIKIAKTQGLSHMFMSVATLASPPWTILAIFIPSKGYER